MMSFRVGFTFNIIASILLDGKIMDSKEPKKRFMMIILKILDTIVISTQHDPFDDDDMESQSCWEDLD